MVELKENYEKIKKRYNLPDFDALDNVFEISAIENKKFLLREIRKLIINKVKANVEILEELIHPNSTISAYHECKFLSDIDKKRLYDLYAKLLKIIRKSNIRDLSTRDELEAVFINDIFKSWPDIKKELLSVLTKLRDCWSKEEIADADTSSYFG